MFDVCYVENNVYISHICNMFQLKLLLHVKNFQDSMALICCHMGLLMLGVEYAYLKDNVRWSYTVHLISKKTLFFDRSFVIDCKDQDPF